MRRDVQPDVGAQSGARIILRAHGMHCHGCERVIEHSVTKLAGVARAKADYPSETVVVDYDPELASLDAVRAAIEEKGYQVFSADAPKPRRGLFARIAAILLSLAGLALLIFIDTRWIGGGGAPDVSRHMSLPLIFTLGLLTGFHCIGMCGAFVIGYTADAAAAGRGALAAHVAYGAGKTLSYTVFGAAFGLLGAFVAFTPLLRGVAGVLAGAFLIVFGLNMLGLFAPLRRFRLGLPGPLRRFVEHESRASNKPFVVGLLNGLMIACGPLQAMYVTAAGTGSAVEGAKMLFAFGLGTLPVLTAFGALASLLSSALTHGLLRASGIIVVALGAVMINRGLILTGGGWDFTSLLATWRRPALVMTTAPEPAAPAPLASSQTIEMEVIASGYAPSRFVLRKDVPVKWIVRGVTITACNKRLLVPKYGIDAAVTPGEQTIEFTPRETGIVPFTCGMGMLRGEFEIVEGPATTVPASPKEAAAQAQAKAQAKTYVVAKGDTLPRIARKLFGDKRRWRELRDANPGIDPNRLRVGDVLKLPDVENAR